MARDTYRTMVEMSHFASLATERLNSFIEKLDQEPMAINAAELDAVSLMLKEIRNARIWNS